VLTPSPEISPWACVDAGGKLRIARARAALSTSGIEATRIPVGNSESNSAVAVVSVIGPALTGSDPAV
jgi:hypothetical protein